MKRDQYRTMEELQKEYEDLMYDPLEGLKDALMRIAVLMLVVYVVCRVLA